MNSQQYSVFDASVLVLFLFAFVVIVPVHARESQQLANCQSYREEVPKYHVLRHYATDKKPGIILFVSVAPADVVRDKLVALGCKLGTDHADADNIFVHIFDSDGAAKKFNPAGEGNGRQINLSYRAFYSFSREKGPAYGQSLTWRPDRNDPNRWLTVDLGPPPNR